MPTGFERLSPRMPPGYLQLGEASPYNTASDKETGGIDTPTGRVFLHNNGAYSSHLNMVGGIPSGGYSYYPLLVPGQYDIAGLLEGSDRNLGLSGTSALQRKIANNAALKNPNGQSFQTPEDAEANEMDWHAWAAAKGKR